MAQPPEYSFLRKEKRFSVSASAHLPVGDFSSTHWIGIGAEVSPARYWFGIFKWKKVRLTYNGGLAYYLGKKEKASGYDYKYPGYFFIHAFGGVAYRPVKKATINLTTGPAIGIYNGTTRFNIGARLESTYFISTSIAIGPGIIFMKESGANPLWSAALKATYVF